MNFSQKLGLFFLIVISVVYVYFSFFNKEGFHFPIKPNEVPQNEISETNNIPKEDTGKNEPEKNRIKTVTIYVTDSQGKLRAVTRDCDMVAEKSCFGFAIRELMKAPSKWEKSKGLSSEIPPETRILSVREGSDNIFIDLSSAFESGGGAESTYIRVKQLIKTAKANTNQPVYLYINGKQANVIGGEGIMVRQPLTERSLDE